MTRPAPAYAADAPTLIRQALCSVRICCIHDTIFAQLHQDICIFTVHTIDILYQFIILLLSGCLYKVNQFFFQFTYFAVYREKNSVTTDTNFLRNSNSLSKDSDPNFFYLK